MKSCRTEKSPPAAGVAPDRKALAAFSGSNRTEQPERRRFLFVGRLKPDPLARYVQGGSTERSEDREGGEDETGDDCRRAEQVPDVFRDFRLAFHCRQTKKGMVPEPEPSRIVDQYTISSQGRPYSLSFCMKGAGSNSSMLKTPGPFHVPVASIMAPIMAGTPVV